MDRFEDLRVAIWGGAAILGFLLLLAVVLIYRRRYRASDESSGTVWSLEALSAMRRRGDLSESEYALLRDRTLAQMGVPRRSTGE